MKHHFSIYGEIIWLWSNSPLHKSWSTSLQARLVIPPVLLNQYLILYDIDNMPAAYCSWAFLDQKSEVNYVLNPNSIEPIHWNSGSKLWFIDFISPFSMTHTLALKSRLAMLFSDKVGSALRVKKDNNVGKIINFSGPNLTPQKAREIRASKLREFYNAVQQHPDLNQNFKLKNFTFH